MNRRARYCAMPGCTYREQKDERCERHQGARIPGAGELFINREIVENEDGIWIPTGNLAPAANNGAVPHS